MALNRVPYRRGLPTMHRLVKLICRLIVEYYDIIVQIIPENQIVYVDALNVACANFVNHVDNPDAGDPLPE